MPNSKGTRGYIDVLARDRHGLFVVIEVKRSNSAAREAIHEVLKYCELLRAERGLRTDQVRAVIASTTWSELIVPFSQLSRVSEYPIDGIELVVDEGFPESLRCERVDPIDVPDERDLSKLALRLELGAPGDATAAWSDVSPHLTSVGIDDALGIVVGNDSRTFLHIALGTVIEGDPRIPELDPDDADDLADEPEYSSAVSLIHRFPGFELVGPERLMRLIQSNQLEVLEVFRLGRFSAQSSLVDDAEAAELAQGTSGWNQVMVMLTGRPSRARSWQRLRTQLDHTLFGNPRWASLLDLWLREIEQDKPDADVVLHVYNPCDLLAALVHGGLSAPLKQLLPEIQGGLDLPGDEGRLIHGTLAWDGTDVSEAEAAIASVYPSQGEWGMARALGGVWELDLQLLEALGIKYELFEFQPGDTLPMRLHEHEGELTREVASEEMTWAGCLPFPAWLRAVDLANLVDQYRSSMVPVNGGDQWLVEAGPDHPT